MQVRAPGREQPPRAARPQDAVVGAQDFQQAGGEYGVAILGALAVLDADQFALAVDIGDFQGHGFGDAEPGAIAGQQHSAVLDAGDVLQEALDFVGGQDDGQFLIQAGAGKIVFIPGHLQGDQVEELHGGNERIDALRGEFPLLGQIQLVLADGFQIQLLGAAVEILGELGHIMDVAALGRAREIAEAHVFDHALS